MFSESTAEFRRILPLLKPHTRNLIWGGLFMAIYVMCWPLLAWLAGQLIPAIGQGDLRLTIEIISKALSVFLIQKIAQFGQDILLAGPALRVSQKLRNELFSVLQKIELDSLKDFSSGDLTYRLTEDADRVGEVIYKTIQDTTPCLLQLIAVFTYMVWLDWKLSIATLLLAPIVAILVGSFGAKVMKAAEVSQKQVSDLAGLLGEAIQGLPLVRAFAAEDWLQNRFNNEVDLHRRARYKTLQLLALQHPVIGFIEAAGILTILGIGAIRIQSGDLNGEGFSSYVAGLLMLIDPISHLTTNFNELKQGQASLKRLRDIEKEPIETNDKNIGNQLLTTTGKLELKNVSFRYNKNPLVLDKLNIKFKPGKVIALVGPSGAGKSTIFSLLLRFKNPEDGRILLDDIDINQLNRDELRRHIGYVPQQLSVFSGTIAESIRFGRNISQDKIIQAAKISNAHQFIMKFKDGYSSVIVERGTNLSGGQIQRIAIARAILGNPSILLLDEATSSLDAEAEQEVQIGLKQAMKGRSVIVIAHRLSTVQEADEILFLDQGKICERGTHEELMSLGGRYKSLCLKQLIRN